MSSLIHFASFTGKLHVKKLYYQQEAASPSGEGAGFEIWRSTMTTSWNCLRQSLIQLLGYT